METISPESQEALNQSYNYAANLLINQRKSGYETKNILIEQGLSEDIASMIVEKLEMQINDAEKDALRSQGKKDMLFGALWLIGGTVLTLANIGFIFWGAILFGGIQFVRGVINYCS